MDPEVLAEMIAARVCPLCGCSPGVNVAPERGYVVTEIARGYVCASRSDCRARVRRKAWRVIDGKRPRRAKS